MTKKKVIIMGGGVAGMSAAHELIERGFEVHVYEKHPNIPGGKARSVPVIDPDDPSSKNPLPGEHGFRFFPGFYKHVIDTMKRIPYPGNKNGVFDNLVPAPYVMMSRVGREPIILPDRFPKSFKDFEMMINAFHMDTGLTEEDKSLFISKIWWLVSSCRERRENNFERLGWWEFTEAEGRSKAYQDLLAKGLTRTLVAAKAKSASTKTGGDIFLQLLFNMANPSIATDRILDGPTTERWLNPWLNYLISKGVQYHFLSEVTQIDCDITKKSITGIHVSKVIPQEGSYYTWNNIQLESSEKLTADYYLMAVPVEVAAKLLIGDILKGQSIMDFTNEILKNALLKNAETSIDDVISETIGKAAIMQADPALIGIVELSRDVAWMNGIQFFLQEVVNLNQGHIIFPDSPWAITAISQVQFWRNFDITTLADGKVKSVLSVDVSDWDSLGVLEYDSHVNGQSVKIKKTARQCTEEEIKKEVWTQMKHALVQNGVPLLRDDMVHTAFIDRDIIFENGTPKTNREPLLVNKVDTWRLRPNSFSWLNNLYFASDYVRTNTDLATMEGANEAARRAVNNIIQASGENHPLCKIWDLHEPWMFSFIRQHDYNRYRKGLKWKEEIPWWIRLIQAIISLFKKGSPQSKSKG